MAISKMEVDKKTKRAFSQLLRSGEAILGIAADDMVSDRRIQRIVDARRMMYHILRRNYKVPYGTIGKLFNKDHSSVFFIEGNHDNTMITQPDYAENFNKLSGHFNNLRGIGRKRRPTLTGDQLLLKNCRALNGNGYSTILSCFHRHDEVSRFISSYKIDRRKIIFCGDSLLITEKMAHMFVEMNEEEFIHSFMKKGGNINEILMNAHPDILYKNYTTGKFDILNVAVDSYRTALEKMGNKPIVLIYAQRQQQEPPSPSAGLSRRSDASRS